jgi:hypothetical protein
MAGAASVAIALLVAAGALVARRLRVPALTRLHLPSPLPRPRLPRRIRVVSS